MYEKRLCILKQLKKGFTADGGLLTGAVYAERTGGEVVITPRIAGLAPLKEGRYALLIWANGSRYLFELKGNAPIRVPDSPSLERGFSALLCFVRGEAEPVAYGFCGSAPAEYSLLMEIFYENGKEPPFVHSEMPQNATQVDVPEEKCEQVQKYHDDEIASSDYFSEDDEGDPQEPEAEPPIKLNRGGLTYYHEIEDKLKETMKRYPKDRRLNGVFPQSEWVKTQSGALLGIIYAEGRPRFLCVAMESEPPEEAREACAFVPLTPYSEEKGMYVVFQDADSGEYVKVENC